MNRFALSDSNLTMANVNSLSDANYDVQNELANFWAKQQQHIEDMDAAIFHEPHHAPELPLARIKKIMKLDDIVKTQMISGEVPVLFSKAAEMFIEELTLRSWVHTEDNKRKTLQKNDMAMAIAKYDQFDFLIDIVPREEIRPGTNRKVGVGVGEAQLFVQQQQQGAAQTINVPPGSQVIPISNEQLQLLIQQVVGGSNAQQNAAQVQPQTIFLPQNGQILQGLGASGGGQQLQVLQLAAPSPSVSTVASSSSATPAANSVAAAVSSLTSAAQMPQVFQQVIGADGNISHVPIQLSSAQLQFLTNSFSKPTTSSASSQASQPPPLSAIPKSQLLKSPPAVRPPQQTFVLQQPMTQSTSGSGAIFLQGLTSPASTQMQQPQFIQLPQLQQHQQVYVQQQLPNGQTVFVPLQQTAMIAAPSSASSGAANGTGGGT